MIPKLYATAWCSSLPGIYAKMVAALEAMVRQDLATHFFPGVEPPATDLSWRYTEAILDFTLMMCKTDRASKIVDESDHQAELKALATEFKHLENRDLRQGFISHYCYLPGCCEGRQRDVAVKKIMALLTSCWL